MPTHDPARAVPDLSERQLLQAIVEVTRGVFGAAAASVFALDPATGDLVFEAVAGEGEEHLVGSRFPSGTGIAGWVAQCGQPLLVDDVSQSRQFGRAAARSTGYVPRSIMAAPLIRDGECVGVLEVLDRGSRHGGELADVELLGMLATGLAVAVEVLLRLRWASGASQDGGASQAGTLLRRVADRLPGATEPVAVSVTQLLTMADQLLSGADRPVRAGA